MKDTTEILSNNDVAVWITAISTIVYTIGTFLLWISTRQSIRVTQNEIKRKEQILNSTYISNVYKNFREIYTDILNDSENANILANEQKLSISDSKKEYMGSFLINHAFEIYNLYKNNLLPDEFWQKIIIDMKVLFEWRFIQNRWQKIRTLYPKEFINFIDENIIKPKIF